MFHSLFRLALDQLHAGQIEVPVDSAEALHSFWITVGFMIDVLYYRRAAALVNTSKLPASYEMSELLV